MSLVQDIATYIEANTSLVMDIDLFVGGETVHSRPGYIVVREFAGSTENESGFEERAIQILASDLGYVNAETLINTVYALFANKPGFVSADLTGILFVSVISMPGFVDRDQSGNYVFSTSLIFKRTS